jgi:D-3-phosphoglycerate dehydrogenase
MNPVERHTIFFDFDSTLVDIESFDELIATSMTDTPDKEEALKKVREVTRKGMEGKMAFQDSLINRLNVSNIQEDMFSSFAERLKGHVTKGFDNYIRALQNAGHKVCILSGGFSEYIIPVARELDIPSSQVFANRFTLDEQGNVVGFDVSNPLIQDNGKSLLIQGLRSQLKINGNVVVIGDGMTDFATYADKQADLFIGCGIHVQRDVVKEKAEHYFTDADALKNFLNDYLRGNA